MDNNRGPEELPRPKPAGRLRASELWSQSYVLAIAINFMVTMVFYTTTTTAMLIAADGFGATGFLLGAAPTAYLAGAILGRVLAGVGLKRLGAKRALAVSFVIQALLMSIAAFGSILSAFLLLLAVCGVAFGLASTAISASVALLVPPNRRGEGIGYYANSATLAAAFAPSIAIVFFDSIGSQSVLLMQATYCLVGLLLLPFFSPGEPRTHTGPVNSRSSAGSSRRHTVYSSRTVKTRRIFALIEPRALPAATLILLASIGFASMISFLGPFAQESGLLLWTTGFFATYSLSNILSRMFMGRLQDRRGNAIVLIPGFLMMALGAFLLSMTNHPFPLLLAGVGFGFGFGTLFPAIQTMAVTRAGPNRVSEATATFFLFLDLGTGIGALVLGSIVVAGGHRTMFALTGVLLLLSTMAAWAILNRTRLSAH